MIKTFLTLLLGLVLLQAARAEKTDSLVYYLKNSGKRVPSKDSADYYRVILAPDTNIDKDLYRVYDYYPNGKIRRVATSLVSDINVVLDGMCISYYPNGKRKEVSQFKNGLLVGSVVSYYPNGKLYAIFKFEALNYYYGYYNSYYRGNFPDPNYNYRVVILEMRDSTGNLLARNGTGHIITFDEDFKKILEEGDMKNNKKEGEWRGLIADSGRFVCNFHRDDLKSGVSYMASGRQYSFKKISVEATFSDGMSEFYRYIKNHTQYPESAKKHNIVGWVSVEFYVETDGRVTDVRAIRGLLKSVDDEAVRVVSASPLWIPGYKFGIPIRTRCRVDVYFSDK